MIKQILLVGLGGGLGSILRFLVSVFTNKYYVGTFPLATFIVNILGCICIGLLIGSIPANSNLRFLFIIGFCGGYTTFSAFANETLTLIQNGQLPTAIIYTLLSTIIGITAVWAGMYFSKQMV